MMSYLSAMMLTSLCSFLHHFSQPDPSQEALYTHSIHTELITDREIFAPKVEQPQGHEYALKLLHGWDFQE